MRVQVRLFATLRKYLPAGHTGDVLTIELPESATAADAVAQLGIPPDHARMIVIGRTQIPFETPLADGQEINVFPPLAGGA